MKHVRATKTGRVLRLVGAPVPPHVQRTIERDREADEVLRNLDTAMKDVPANAAAMLAEADAELARHNFSGASRRAKQPCSCEEPKERSCPSCVARDDILRSRGDWR